MTDPFEPFYRTIPEPPPPPRPRRRGHTLTLLVVVVLAAVVGAGAVIALRGGSGHGTAAAPATSPAVSPGASQPAPAATASPGTSVSGIPVPPTGAAPAAASKKLDAQTVTDKVQPSMVDIDAPQAYAQSLSEGTGIILTSTGLVLTNNHVIEGATAPTVTLVNSGKTYKATIVGYDSAADVALLQLAGASGLTPVTVGNSDHVAVGQAILGLGNAQGQGGTPTIAPGQVTALNQTISPADSATGAKETLHGTIQTSAQIQPGDSGGPLANAAGQVIGVDVAASQAQGLNGTTTTAGFAIPINQALQIASQIAARQGTSTVHIGLPGFFGVSVADAATGCTAGSGGAGGFGGSGESGGSTSSGAIICGVFSGTPAQSAKLEAGDVITSVNGKSVSNANSLIAATAGYRPGQSLTVGYVDNSGTTQSATLTLIGGPAK
ncbi:MAG TPA: trypsin-like peptidase domain-containing protein [Trebonia sp.]|jgi:S1-C subfamily serine protease|nr:trypsin-like peptidase domain-containing protein [Trebonia sp.]